MNSTIASYRRCNCLCRLNRSLRLPSPLVFTVTAFEISLFQALERQYQRFQKVQVSKIFQGLAVQPQTPELNDCLASIFSINFGGYQRQDCGQVEALEPLM